MPRTMLGVSIRECARQLGVSDTAIRKAIDAGRCSKLADGSVDVAAVREGMALTANPFHGGQRHAGVFGSVSLGPVVQAGPPATESGQAEKNGASSPAGAGGGSSGGDQAKLLKARLLSEETRAAREQLELAELLGQVARIEPMTRAVFDAMTEVHSALRALPDRLTPLVTPETDPAKVYGIIEEEVTRLANAVRDALEQKVAAATATATTP